MNNLAVHFSSETDQWATPQEFFNKLNEEFNFELDVCADDINAKCVNYITKNCHVQQINAFDNYVGDGDGIRVEWHRFAERCWMNPPYGRTIGKWVKKAYEESKKGCLVVCLLPSRTDTRWFHDFIYNKPGVEIRFLKGRLKFGDATNSAPFPSMVVIFRPELSNE